MSDESEPKPTGDGLSRRALIADLRAGEESAYAEVFHEYYTDLRDYAYSYLRQWDDATDVVQQVFANLFLSRQSLREGEGIHAYLYTAVRNRVINTARSRNVRQRWLVKLIAGVTFRSAASRNDGEHEVLRGEIADRVRGLIDQLPPKCKDAFVLVRMHELTYAEAAEVLGVLESTIATHLVRATKILGRQLLELGLIDGAVRPGGRKKGKGGGRDDQ